MISFLVLALSSIAACTGESIPDFSITDAEIRNLVNQLRSEDENKARPGQIVLSYQGHTSTRDSSDNADRKLFAKVDTSLLRKPTYEQYAALMNNWNRMTGVKEPAVSEKEEKEEVGKFLTTVLNTKPWQTLYKFLVSKGHPFARDQTTFRYWVAQLWFVHYSRARGLPDTSGFEHIFMGETKNGEISGMHNWVRFYLLEKNITEQFDYKGFIVKRFNLMAAVKFTWKGELKRSGSFLVGTSPEFDMALYTICFLSRRGRQTCDVEIDGCPLQITSYDLLQNNKVFIGSVFPSAGRITDQCRRQNGR